MKNSHNHFFFCSFTFIVSLFINLYERDATAWLVLFKQGRNPYTLSFPYFCTYPLLFLCFCQILVYNYILFNIINTACMYACLRLSTVGKKVYPLAFYCYFHFDFIVLLSILLGLRLIGKKKFVLAGSIMGFGAGIKFFPIIVLIGLFFRLRSIEFFKTAVGSLIIYLLPYVLFPKFAVYLFSPYLHYTTFYKMDFLGVIIRGIFSVLTVITLLSFIMTKGGIKSKFEHYIIFFPAFWIHHLIYYYLIFKNSKIHTHFILTFIAFNYLLAQFVNSMDLFILNWILNICFRVYFALSLIERKKRERLILF